MEDILDAGIDYSILFYNPNIHPIDEYNLRKNENIRFAEKNNIEFIDLDYDTENWFKRIKGFEDTPERGYRCTICFEMRFERTALYAFDNGFDIITSCLGISRWKNMDQINTAGTLAASRYPSISYWTYNWRKAGGSKRMIELAKEEEFYQQQYCGCVYSLRDTNRWRLKNNRSRVKLGQDYYKKEQ
ncbi:MAG: epoxyqueuosine reductase QueH [Legionellales bacterium]|nr:epoxyqueuosine reductase QueH [Legionellales bacterium]